MEPEFLQLEIFSSTYSKILTLNRMVPQRDKKMGILTKRTNGFHFTLIAHVKLMGILSLEFLDLSLTLKKQIGFILDNIRDKCTLMDCGGHCTF